MICCEQNCFRRASLFALSHSPAKFPQDSEISAGLVEEFHHPSGVVGVELKFVLAGCEEVGSFMAGKQIASRAIDALRHSHDFQGAQGEEASGALYVILPSRRPPLYSPNPGHSET